MTTIALVGNRSDRVPAHASLDRLIPHLDVTVDWVESQTVGDSIGSYDGIWVIPGSPYADKTRVLETIRLARETGVPYLGTCGGFQHALIEYVRTVLGFEEAEDVQYDPETPTPFIVPLSCSMIGETATLHLADGSRLAAVYAHAESTEEVYHCKYGLNPEYFDTIGNSELVISGWDAEQAPRAVELPDHPFFIATLFQPELSSTPGSIHPLIEAFLAAATLRSGATADSDVDMRPLFR